MCDFSAYGGKSPEWVALERTLPAPDPDITDAELKRSANETREEASREEMKTLSFRVSMQDHSIPARDGTMLEARSYRSTATGAKQLPIYIYFHGGGFFFGTLSSDDAICAQTALDVEVVVMNVNYRHTPEFVYPTAFHDSEDAFDWVCANADIFSGDRSQIVIGGTSAGGLLTASLVQTLFRETHPARSNVRGQVAMVPSVVQEWWYDAYMKQMKSPAVSSYVQNEFAPILPMTRVRFYNQMEFRDGIPERDDRKANPGLATREEVARLPPTTIGVCGADPFRDEGLLYAKLLQEARVPTNAHVFKGLPHDFSRFGDKLSASKTWDEVVHEGIRWALSVPPPARDFEIHAH